MCEIWSIWLNSWFCRVWTSWQTHKSVSCDVCMRKYKIKILKAASISHWSAICDRQFYWAKGCPDSWQNHFWDCLWGCFQKRRAFESDWVKKIALTNVAGHRPIHWGLESDKRRKKGKFSHLKWGHPFSPTLGHLSSWFSGLQILGFTAVSPPVLRLSDSDWVIPLAFLVLQLADSISWDFSASIITSQFP